MQLKAKMIDRIEAMSQLLKKSPERVLEEALDLYLKQERDKQLEVELEEHKKETDLSYNEFWDDMDLD